VRILLFAVPIRYASHFSVFFLRSLLYFRTGRNLDGGGRASGGFAGESDLPDCRILSPCFQTYTIATSMLHNNDDGKHFILQTLGCPSITGRSQGLHVHRHVYSTVFLYYNRNRDAGCYKSYNGRIFGHYRDDILFMAGLTYVGIHGGRACLNGWDMYDDIRYRTPCIFRPYLLPDCHILDPNRHSNVGFPEIKFTCPTIKNCLMLGGRHFNPYCLRTETDTSGVRIWPNVEAEECLSWWAYHMGIHGASRDDFLFPRKCCHNP
jgi:hypothetical protein